MKFRCITFLCCCIILLVSITSGCMGQTEYLRIHVRANSNSQSDQQVKYLVRDEVVKYLSPLVVSCVSKQQAIAVVKHNESAINGLIDALLAKNGFNYTSRVKVIEEFFPTRVYESVTLESGYYDAVIIELGSAKGENWWCVVYPPLCFLGEESVKYRSKIFDIINGNRD